MLSDIAAGIKHATESEPDGQAWVRRYAGAPEDRSVHQFLVMLKPELTQPVDGPVEPVLKRVVECLSAHEVDIGAIRVLSSGYLRHHGLIRQHYPWLSDVSRNGWEALSRAARERLRHWRRDASPHRLLGGHQFVDRHPELTPYALEVLTRNVAVEKLGTGAYGIDILLDGERWIILNPFHPYQERHFTAPGRSIVLMECRSTRPLPDIRHGVIGVTDPASAAPGSIKRVLVEEARSLGLGSICTRRNGIHISPGAVEAMASIQRYFSEQGRPINVAQTDFGARLLSAGCDAESIARLGSDPEIDIDGHSGPLFELTEDMNWMAAFTFVRDVLGRGLA